jgi:hypothetical protein
MKRNVPISVEKNGRSGEEADKVGSFWQWRSERRGHDLCNWRPGPLDRMIARAGWEGRAEKTDSRAEELTHMAHMSVTRWKKKRGREWSGPRGMRCGDGPEMRVVAQISFSHFLFPVLFYFSFFLDIQIQNWVQLSNQIYVQTHAVKYIWLFI